MKMAKNPAMAPQFWPQSITQDLPFSNREGHNSYGPGPSQWAQAIWVRKWSMDLLDSQRIGQFWPWGALVTPRTIGHQKGPKRAPMMIWSKIAIVMARTQNTQEGPKWPKSSCRPIQQDIGDKPPPWSMPKGNEVEEDPRGTTGHSIMGIYVHIIIIHHFLRRRALRPSFWMQPKVHASKRKILIEF
ncbi:hypothetical protein O181_056516 [Austropuccinia psidii MF-1]|uniref:Uncharacterized protein n=1 Tax=Austropuccinia psidii MF-1 TaxID=1389203 RepID=A0A9Q3EDE0_9BASI|nr:hypothetical protein [Austropuccinia psidii MF-1]